MADALTDAAADWLAARAVIVEFLRELRPDQDAATRERNAAALIARLAAHNPPILLEVQRPDPPPPG